MKLSYKAYTPSYLRMVMKVTKVLSLIILSLSIDGVKTSFFTLIYSFFILARARLTATLILTFYSFKLI
jgi:hypothetical protein